eukprot:SM000037S13575  [mRNA]  locus=s37:866017:869778:+ [translate_table: standard]
MADAGGPPARGGGGGGRRRSREGRSRRGPRWGGNSGPRAAHLGGGPLLPPGPLPPAFGRGGGAGLPAELNGWEGPWGPAAPPAPWPPPPLLHPPPLYARAPGPGPFFLGGAEPPRPPRGRLAAGGGGRAPSGRGPSRSEQNDYSQHFVDTGQRPQKFIRDVDLADRFEEYPKLKELIARKDRLIAERATPPMYMRMDLRKQELSPELFGTKFDVILLDPPWEEYVRRAPGVADALEWWPPEDVLNLKLEAIAYNPSYVFLWVGDAEGLEHGRAYLKKVRITSSSISKPMLASHDGAFAVCEDICWVKTNREKPMGSLRHDVHTLFQHSKVRLQPYQKQTFFTFFKSVRPAILQIAHTAGDASHLLHEIGLKTLSMDTVLQEHCLMGIKGTVRRSTDSHLIHANVDTDIIISEEPPYGSTRKPEELYHIIEHFAQGRRRLELFGEDHNIRAGWITAGTGLTSSNFFAETYSKFFLDADGKAWVGWRSNPPPNAPHLLGSTPEIEALRPKSPPRRDQPSPRACEVANLVSLSSHRSKVPLALSRRLQQSHPFLSLLQQQRLPLICAQREEEAAKYHPLLHLHQVLGMEGHRQVARGLLHLELQQSMLAGVEGMDRCPGQGAWVACPSHLLESTHLEQEASLAGAFLAAELVCSCLVHTGPSTGLLPRESLTFFRKATA